MKVLEIKNLTFSYSQSEPLFENLNLKVNAGEIAFISGLNGSGKTTLARFICGLNSDNVTINKDFEMVFNGRKKFHPAYVPQELNSQFLYDNLYEETNFFLKYSNVKISKSVEEIAKDGEFCNILRKKTSVLSDGEKQNYLVNMAVFFSQDKILVLDEPLSFLDSYHIGIFKRKLFVLKKLGYVIIIFGHFPDVLEDIIDSFYKIEAGKLICYRPLKKKKQFLSVTRRGRKKVLNTINLALSYNGEFIFKGLNVEFYSGSIHGVYGPNGCGKTSLVKILAGIYTKFSGEIRLNNYVVDCQELRRNIFLILANPLNQITSFNVRYFLEKHRLSLDKLKILKLDKKLTFPISRLSYGEMQKLLIFMAVNQKPSMIIIDEPLPSFDEESEKIVFSLLGSYVNDGGSALIVSHRKELLENFCDSIYEMKYGRIAEN